MSLGDESVDGESSIKHLYHNNVYCRHSAIITINNEKGLCTGLVLRGGHYTYLQEA